MDIQNTITPETRIKEVLKEHPTTVRVFHRLGLDACCGGSRTLADATAAHGLELEMVMAELWKQAATNEQRS
jgi:regulator of cell morphogenesis and NO signaling